jgi:hypothetical protein
MLHRFPDTLRVPVETKPCFVSHYSMFTDSFATISQFFSQFVNYVCQLFFYFFCLLFVCLYELHKTDVLLDKHSFVLQMAVFLVDNVHKSVYKSLLFDFMAFPMWIIQIAILTNYDLFFAPAAFFVHFV